MSKKLIISESQLKMLKKHLNESNHYSNMVNTIVDDLNSNYKKVIETYRDGNDYKKRKMFEVSVDGDIISPKDLLEYLKSKYNLGENFLKNLLNDWCDNKINNGMLSSNVSMDK